MSSKFMAAGPIPVYNYRMYYYYYRMTLDKERERIPSKRRHTATKILILPVIIVVEHLVDASLTEMIAHLDDKVSNFRGLRSP